MNWSSYQQDLFDAVASGLDIELEAVAGSGKSTTIFEVIRRTKKLSLYLAFNKSVQEHAESKVGTCNSCTIKTLNAFGLQIIKSTLNPKVQVNVNKIKSYVAKNKELLYKSSFVAFISRVRRLNLGPENYDNVLDEAPNILIRNELFNNIEYIINANKELDADIKTVDFDDMLRFPYIYDLIPKLNMINRIILLDEAHDVNSYQVDMISKLQLLGNQIVYVGDRSQAIYEFRGALSDSMDKLRESVNPSTLTLPITYRCKSVLCNFVNDVLSPYTKMIPSTEGGSLSTIKLSETADYVINNSVGMIVSPTNINLIKLWIKLAIKGNQSSLKGSKIVDALRKHLDPYSNMSVSKYYNEIDKLDKSKLSNFNAEIISGTIEIINAYKIKHINELSSVLDQMDCSSDVNLHTVHSSKGLESKSVVVVNRWFPSNQLNNMKYVACTRAMDNLTFATTDADEE